MKWFNNYLLKGGRKPNVYEIKRSKENPTDYLPDHFNIQFQVNIKIHFQ